jgi:mRNA interferase RelE/StbE
VVSYEVLTTRKANKAIARLPGTAYQRVKDAIKNLANDPRPPGCGKLSGREGYRIRVGDYRIIYRVNDQARTVEVFRVAHRGDAYGR